MWDNRREIVDTLIVRNLSYIPSFHGLRAIACLAVFGVHLEQIAGVSGQVGPFELGLLLRNGNTGVCLFFMMSGFLLSIPFWARDPESKDHRFQPLRFAAKRVSRIVPAYYLCLTALILLGKADGTLDIALHYLFTHNFTDKTLYSISDPFWTLAVQAQFYILFPFILLLIRPFLRAKPIAFVVLFAGCIGAFFAHQGLLDWASQTTDWPIAASVLSPTGSALHVSILAHLPHFLMGMLAASLFVALRGFDDEAAETDGQQFPAHFGADVLFLLFAFGLLAMLAVPDFDVSWRIPTGVVEDKKMVGRYNFPYVPILIAGILITGPFTVIARRLLEAAPLRLLGIISFGIYVYHLPCLGVAKRLVGGDGDALKERWLMLALVGLALSIAVAGASYVFVERPLFRLARRWSSN